MRKLAFGVMLSAVSLIPGVWATGPAAAANAIYRSAQGTVVRQGATWTVTMVCHAEAYGGDARTVKINSCVARNSKPGSVRAVEGITLPGRFGLTAGVGNLKKAPPSTFDVCMSVTAVYLNGSKLTVNDCNVPFAFVAVP